MKQIIYFIVFLFVLGACREAVSEHKDSVIETISWPPADPLFTKELIDSVELISFEVSDSAIFGYPIFISYTPDRIFVIGNESGAKIRAFDKQGKFLNIIGQRGRGPGEYLNVYNWNVIKDTLYVGDCIQNKLLVFSADGNFIREIQIPEQVREELGGQDAITMNVKPLKNGYYITTMRNVLNKDLERKCLDYLVTDFNFKKVRDAEKETNKENTEGFIACINRRSGDTLTILDRWGKEIKQYYFDFGSNRVTPEIYAQLSVDEIRRNKTVLTNALLMGDYVFLDLVEEGKRARCVLQWKSGQFYVNDGHGGMRERILNIMSCCPEEHSLISIISTPRSTGFKELPEDLQVDLEENGGTVLVKYWIKK